jgi:hypothetical protein
VFLKGKNQESVYQLDLELENPGIESRHGQGIFLSSKTSRPTWKSPSRPLRMYRGSFQMINRPKREVDHRPPSRAEINNEWSYDSTPHIRVHARTAIALPLLTVYIV